MLDTGRVELLCRAPSQPCNRGNPYACLGDFPHGGVLAELPRADDCPELKRTSTRLFGTPIAIRSAPPGSGWFRTLEGNDSVVVETGLYNLTNDEVPVLVHFSPDRQELRTLIRLAQPEDQGRQP